MDSKACWGYEQDCEMENAFSSSICPGDHKGWVATKSAQLETFYAQGDFGYIRDQKREMDLLCEPLFFVSDFYAKNLLSPKIFLILNFYGKLINIG